MRILGIDMGSREVKIALMENSIITKKFKLSTVSFYKEYCSYKNRIIVDTSKLGFENIDKGISTGYGRNNIDLQKFEPINEIKAHVYGVFYQLNLKDFILLDVGGQDVKIVKVEKGVITDLELNEKCAASCGRYLENMANILEIPLEEMFKHYENPVEINSTCAVFSESELIGKIAEGNSFHRLCSGVNYSLYKRLHPMLSNFKGKNLVLSGGVAMNSALQRYLSMDFDNVICLNEPQYNGAIGCCYYGNLKKS